MIWDISHFFFAWLKPFDYTLEKAREYLKIHRRRPNVFGSYSLNTPISEDSGMIWLGTKTDEDRLWKPPHFLRHVCVDPELRH